MMRGSQATATHLHTTRHRWVLAGVLAMSFAGGCAVEPSADPAEDGASEEPVGEVSDAFCPTGPAFPSCYGQCGHLSCSPAFPEICCACDPGCAARGDCCCDIDTYCSAPPPAPSCEGHCDGMAPEGCWCDEMCSSFGDCCEDVDEVCTFEPSCEGHCGGASPDGCFCDHLCEGFGDCCGDVATTCNPAVEITAGESATCAVNGTGAVRCWGLATFGELGYGNLEAIGDDETPRSAGNVPIGAGVRYVGMGEHHACALLLSGGVRCWGHNNYGQLGYGHTEDIGDDETPSSAGNVALGGTVTQLAVGNFHNCALLSTGVVRCWGANYRGQLGYGHTSSIGNDETPASVGTVNVGGTVVELAAGTAHTCARLSSGLVRCWGSNVRGELGIGNTNDVGDDEVPAAAPYAGVGGVVTDIEAGQGFTCARLVTGAVRCWGWNQFGRLGYGNLLDIGDDELPASAGDIDVGATVTSLGAMDRWPCAIRATGDLRCWGRNSDGQLGLGHSITVGDDETPAAGGDAILGGTVKRAATGLVHACAILTDGPIRCWGLGYARLGYGLSGPIGDDETPASAGDVDVF